MNDRYIGFRFFYKSVFLTSMLFDFHQQRFQILNSEYIRNNFFLVY